MPYDTNNERVNIFNMHCLRMPKFIQTSNVKLVLVSMESWRLMLSKLRCKNDFEDYRVHGLFLGNKNKAKDGTSVSLYYTIKE